MNSCTDCFWRIWIPAARESGDRLPAANYCSHPIHTDGAFEEGCEEFEKVPRWAKWARLRMKRKVEEAAELEGRLMRETEKAWQIVFPGKGPVWVPKSQSEITERKGNIVTVEIKEWFAKKLGLI